MTGLRFIINYVPEGTMASPEGMVERDLHIWAKDILWRLVKSLNRGLDGIHWSDPFDPSFQYDDVSKFEWTIKNWQKLLIAVRVPIECLYFCIYGFALLHVIFFLLPLRLIPLCNLSETISKLNM